MRLADPADRAHAGRERDALAAAAAGLPALSGLRADLAAVNAELWRIEDDIRACEAAQDFGPRFVALARAVYLTNDRRAALKRAVNDAVGSAIVEVKSHAAARPGPASTPP